MEEVEESKPSPLKNKTPLGQAKIINYKQVDVQEVEKRILEASQVI